RTTGNQRAPQSAGSAGRFVCQFVADSNACAAAYTVSSSNGLAAIWRPSGSPAGAVEKPIGSTSAGNPQALNMRRKGCVTFAGSPAGTGIPGVTNTSSALNVTVRSAVNLARTFWARRYCTAVTSDPASTSRRTLVRPYRSAFVASHGSWYDAASAIRTI